MKHENKFFWLDLIRGLSALAVFSGHLRVLCFKDIPPSELNILGKIVFFITGFGHEAVMVFFVLSGFFIIRSIDEAVVKDRWNFLNYTNNRLIRLWVVLLPALFMGLFFDKIGITFLSDSLGYSNQIKYFTHLNLKSNLSPVSFLGNSFFLQTILVPTFGSNGSLWSLANEFWYYIIFPFLYFSIHPKYNLISRIVFGLLAVLLLLMVGDKIALYFIVWLLGGVSYLLFKKRDRAFFTNRIALLLLLTLFFFALVMIRFKQMPIVFNDFSLAIIFSILVPALTVVDMKSRILRKISVYFSNISYTLYLAHLPFNFFITGLLAFQVKDWGYSNFLIFTALVSVTVLYATGMWYLFERNTPVFKKWLTFKSFKVQTNQLKLNSRSI